MSEKKVRRRIEFTVQELEELESLVEYGWCEIGWSEDPALGRALEKISRALRSLRSSERAPDAGRVDPPTQDPGHVEGTR